MSEPTSGTVEVETLMAALDAQAAVNRATLDALKDVERRLQALEWRLGINPKNQEKD